MNSFDCATLSVYNRITYRGFEFNPYEEHQRLEETDVKVGKLETAIWALTAQIESLNQALEKMDAELCKYKPALELGMMYVAKQEFDEALKRM